VYNADGRRESRELLDRLRNSDTFHVIRYVNTDQELNDAIVSGKCRVGIKIPVDYSDKLLHQMSAQVLVLIDGSDSSVAGQAINVTTAIGLDESLKRVLANSGAKPGDRLIFTKAIGTGVISTAIKRRKAEFAWIRGAVHAMTTLNKTATEVVSSGGFAVHAMTDVTGFGLIGHLREVARGSGVSVRLFASKVPVLEGALECVRNGYVPGGLKSNRGFAEGCVLGRAAVAVEEDDCRQ